MDTNNEITKNDYSSDPTQPEVMPVKGNGEPGGEEAGRYVQATGEMSGRPAQANVPPPFQPPLSNQGRAAGQPQPAINHRQSPCRSTKPMPVQRKPLRRRTVIACAVLPPSAFC